VAGDSSGATKPVSIEPIPSAADHPAALDDVAAVGSGS
jgi:hypothetical protein